MSNIKRILVLGSDGQLGRELQYISQYENEFDFDFVNRSQLDITTSEGENKIIKYQPDLIVNCAAYTAVDQAESDWLSCIKVNQFGTSNIAKAAKKLEAIMIHISSDYVYHINKGKPIKEEESGNPQSIYAISKANGEVLAKHLNPKTIILRTSWIYSTFGGNFVKTILKLSQSKAELTIVDDQFGSPTYARDLAHVILQVIQYIKMNPSDKEVYGVYNFTNEGITTWKAFATEIFVQSGIEMKINAISTEKYGAPAKRPHWSVMSMSKIKAKFNIKTRHWRESLKDMLILYQHN